jgi:hypothetical protein
MIEISGYWAMSNPVLWTHLHFWLSTSMSYASRLLSHTHSRSWQLLAPVWTSNSYYGLAMMLSRSRELIRTHSSEDSPPGNRSSTSRRGADPPFSWLSSFGEHSANEDSGICFESMSRPSVKDSGICYLSNDLDMLYDAIPNLTRSAGLCALQSLIVLCSTLFRLWRSIVLPSIKCHAAQGFR